MAIQFQLVNRVLFCGVKKKKQSVGQNIVKEKKKFKIQNGTFDNVID